MCCVPGCGRPVEHHGHSLCRWHEHAFVVAQRIQPHVTLTTFVRGRAAAEAETLVCDCLTPEPDGLGQCDHCGRRVVTFTDEHSRDLFRRRYPDEWDRAVQMSLFPRVRPEATLHDLAAQQ